jgi:hypothetical protein
MNRAMKVAAGFVRATIAFAIVGIIALPLVWSLSSPVAAIA